MATIKSARHHWWPECVSELWKDDSGLVHWLAPDGEVRTAPPKNFGVIGNAHVIKFGGTQSSPWDESFESQFQRADNDFPSVIQWLNRLDRHWISGAQSRRERFLAQPLSHDRADSLVECIVSLAVRSPMFREIAVGAAEALRGPLPEAERNPIIALNMRRCQRMIADSLRRRGRLAILYSPRLEFVFGDGFYNAATSISTAPMTANMIVPLTPDISVLYARPMRYMTEPRLVTIVLAEAEAAFLNETVQVYARNAVFYRTQKPKMTDAFSRRQHLQYSRPDNGIESFIHDIPGIPPRDNSFDHLLDDLR